MDGEQPRMKLLSLLTVSLSVQIRLQCLLIQLYFLNSAV